MANAEADAAGHQTRTAHTSSLVGPGALITPCPFDLALSATSTLNSPRCKLLLRGGERRPGQRRGSCRSSRRGRAVLSSTTACTAPRTRWRSSRARCRSGPSFLASFEARVCVSASACLLCVSALRGCLGREIKPHSVLRPLRTPGLRGCILFWIVRKKKTPRKMKTPVLSKTEKKSFRVCRGVESSQKLNES